jgi:hypothetical protein
VGWVTLDDGQHVYIGAGGKVLPRGPGGGEAKSGFALKGGTSTAQGGLAGLKAGPSKPARPAFASGAPVADTGVRARLAQQIKAQRAVAQVQAHPETHAQPGDVVNMGVNHIAFDPERFQYKLSTTGEHGVTSQLHQVKQWNPESAGVISVWKDPADGKTYVVNGHHRLDLANRLGVDKVTARFIDAPDAATARMKGAITNIAEGRGTPIDAAKFFREAGGRDLIMKHGIPMTEHTAKHGLNRAAERLHAGEKAETVYRDTRKAISGHVKDMLSGGAAAFAA